MTDRKKDNKGLIFNIQRFSIHDGPGIRTTVFMKGCPLRCLWCSNPESQDFFPNLIVRDVNCKGCGACVKACPEKAIAMTRDEGRKIDWSKCNQCLECAKACIYNALMTCGHYMPVSDVVDEILKDVDFYRNSGGGMTVSGGEALSQGSFSADLLAACKREGLHTALDTTGYASWETMKSVIDHVDLVLFDIKHLDRLVHLRTTGVENGIILENLLRLSGKKEVWLRMPLIAGFNDSEDHLVRVTELAKQAGARKLSLLPYHEGGMTKCRQLGRSYPWSDAKAPDDEHLLKLKELIASKGIHASVGN
jgi:pyruvate formate lyase activating enzyme